jgi:cytochrome c553
VLLSHCLEHGNRFFMSRRIPTAFFIVLVGIVTACSAAAEGLKKSSSVGVTLYDPDPGHIANRVYEALFTWKGDQEVAPSHWPQQRFSLDSAKVRAVLDELFKTDIRKEIPDPVKCVFLQRDLWLIFDWLGEESSRGGVENPVIQRRLARCIQHLALPITQLRQLPDNYNDQLASDTYAVEYDGAHPETPFLPSSLWARNGPWILIGDRERTVLTEQHRDFFRGHTAYMVFMRLPAGRDATINYLTSLNSYIATHEKLPVLPSGTQVALVGQAMAIDDKGLPYPTTVTESVQLRVYRNPEKSLAMADDAQSRFEFRLDRPALLAHQPATLRAVDARQTDWEFINYLGKKQAAPEAKGSIMSSCADCHNEAGAKSFKTFVDLHTTHGAARQMTLSSRALEVGKTVSWKRSQLDFQLLTQFWGK